MEKKKAFLIQTAYWLTIAAMIYLTFRYAIFVVMPFLIGFSIAVLLNPLVRLLSRRFGMKRKPCAILILLIFLGTIGMLVTVAVVRLMVWLGDFSSALPELYRETVEPMLNQLFEWMGNFLLRMQPNAESSFSAQLPDLLISIQTALGDAVSEWSVHALTQLSLFVAKLPRFAIELLFAVIASFFFLMEYEELLNFCKARLPRRAVGLLLELREHFFVTIGRYVRSYALILLITFSELALGLLLLGVEHALWYAAVIALLDVLPLIGCGGILIPWAFFSLCRKNGALALGLMVVWAIITVIRNIIEPRIVGRQVGLHPLLTLAAMFIGSKLFGMVGLITLPIGLSIVFSVWREQERSTDCEAR